MSKLRLYGVALLSTACMSIPARSTPLLIDTFAGPSLNAANWVPITGSSGVAVANGTLTLSGGPDHKRINSVSFFQPSSASVFVEARATVVLGGDYQKFGFGVNGESGPVGFYFDSWDHNLSANTNSVRALVYSQQGGLLLEQPTAATWGSFHDLTVQWLPTKVNFLVDGNRIASFQPISGIPSLPLGIWNDRTPTMLVDRAEVHELTFDDVIRNSVVASIQSGMHAEFRPNFSLTLDEAATLGGFDHFNWANIIVLAPAAATEPAFRDRNGNPPQVAFFDAVPGGYAYQAAAAGLPFPVRDSRYWYLDEEYALNGHRVTPGNALTTILDDLTTDSNADGADDLLAFHDAPCAPSEVHFYTALVGVKANGAGTFFQNTAFRWGVNAGPNCDIFRLDAITPGSVNGDVAFLTHVGDQPMPADVKALLLASGVAIANNPTASVPEPGTLLLAVLAVVLALRRTSTAR